MIMPGMKKGDMRRGPRQQLLVLTLQERQAADAGSP